MKAMTTMTLLCGAMLLSLLLLCCWESPLYCQRHKDEGKGGGKGAQEQG